MRALVVGLEKSGAAAVRLLQRRGAHVRTTDVKPEAALPGVPFEEQSPAVFGGVDLIVTSPGVPADLPELLEAQRRGIRVIGDLDLAAPELKGKTIGITGSNGKTTTTALVGHILKKSGIPVQVGGNIGTPVAGMVDTSRADQWNVLELSSFQLEIAAEFRAHVAVGLNVTQNHLDRHHTFERYVEAKARLFELQQPEDYAVLNADDPVALGFVRRSRPVWFSSTRAVTPGLWVEGGRVLFDGEGLMPVAEIPIRGRHNVENVMAAAAAARLAGASLEQIAAAVRTFEAVEHRLEFVRRARGIDFYNDSKATSVDATLKALDAFDGGLWVILGGKDKGLDYSVLRDPLRAKAKAVLTVGAAAAKIGEQVRGAVPVMETGTIDRAVREAYARAAPGDTVLLAPACASFDQFRSFEHRGQAFKEIVKGLEE